MTKNNELLEEFKKNASNASYHHADDSGREWGQARKYEDRCKEIWANADEELKASIREAVKTGGYLIDFWHWGK